MLAVMSQKSELSVADLKKGDRVCVVGYHQNSDNYAQRLRSLGLIPGTQVLVKRFAPLGDPIELHFRGSRLTLRPAEAHGLILERI
jgi:Fe2+ transport system protein FeoA